MENTFDFFTYKDNGKRFITRFRQSLWQIADDNKYPYLVGIAIPIAERENNFPGNAENSMLLILEEKITQALEEKSDTIRAGAIIGDGMKEFIFYTNNPEKVKKILNKLSDEINGYNIQMNVESDPEWTFFKMHCPQSSN